jgi:anti-anti-sigma factor
MKLKLVSIERKGYVRVATEGDLTRIDVGRDQANPLANPLEAILGKLWSHNRVLLDCSRTEYLDSSAVGWIIGTNRALREGGGKLILHSIQPAVRQILDVLKVGKAVVFAVDETAAIAAL